MWYTLKVEIKIKEEKMTKLREDIRNVAIIAHVDHGKTTLVDELLKQSHTLDERKELDERAMDSNDLAKRTWNYHPCRKIQPLLITVRVSTSWIHQVTRTSVEKLNVS